MKEAERFAELRHAFNLVQAEKITEVERNRLLQEADRHVEANSLASKAEAERQQQMWKEQSQQVKQQMASSQAQANAALQNQAQELEQMRNDYRVLANEAAHLRWEFVTEARPIIQEGVTGIPPS